MKNEFKKKEAPFFSNKKKKKRKKYGFQKFNKGVKMEHNSQNTQNRHYFLKSIIILEPFALWVKHFPRTRERQNI